MNSEAGSNYLPIFDQVTYLPLILLTLKGSKKERKKEDYMHVR